MQTNSRVDTKEGFQMASNSKKGMHSLNMTVQTQRLKLGDYCQGIVNQSHSETAPIVDASILSISAKSTNSKSQGITVGKIVIDSGKIMQVDDALLLEIGALLSKYDMKLKESTVVKRLILNRSKYERTVSQSLLKLSKKFFSSSAHRYLDSKRKFGKTWNDWAKVSIRQKASILGFPYDEWDVGSCISESEVKEKYDYLGIGSESDWNHAHIAWLNDAIDAADKYACGSPGLSDFEATPNEIDRALPVIGKRRRTFSSIEGIKF